MNIFGVKIDKKRKIRYALTSLYGIGYKTSNNICNNLGLSKNMMLKELSEKQIFYLIKYIEQYYIIEDNLRKYNNDNILRLFKSKNYRGSRHLYDFPVRGQRTSTNAKTQKRLQRFKKFF